MFNTPPEKALLHSEVIGLEREINSMFRARLTASFRLLDKGGLTPELALITLVELKAIRDIGRKFGMAIADAEKET